MWHNDSISGYKTKFYYKDTELFECHIYGTHLMLEAVLVASTACSTNLGLNSSSFKLERSIPQKWSIISCTFHKFWASLMVLCRIWSIFIIIDQHIFNWILLNPVWLSEFHRIGWCRIYTVTYLWNLAPVLNFEAGLKHLVIALCSIALLGSRLLQIKHTRFETPCKLSKQFLRVFIRWLSLPIFLPFPPRLLIHVAFRFLRYRRPLFGLGKVYWCMMWAGALCSIPHHLDGLHLHKLYKAGQT